MYMRKCFFFIQESMIVKARATSKPEQFDIIGIKQETYDWYKKHAKCFGMSSAEELIEFVLMRRLLFDDDNNNNMTS
jgi:hypothetical protein